MIRSDFYQDKKYCPRCSEYVRYLQSLDSSFCVECGAKVRLFSAADKREFLKSLKSGRKTGRKDHKRVS